MASESAPVLSTPAEHIFEDPSPVSTSNPDSRLSEEQLYLQYEIKRTIHEIRNGGWRRIALQFPDDMLVDAPRIYERLQRGLRESSKQPLDRNESTDPTANIASSLETTHLSNPRNNVDAGASTAAVSTDDELTLCILGDTSYGACCVDEVAAEHVDAEVVVHYGRACLSPTARLPVIYVSTAKPLDLESAQSHFKQTFSDESEKICLMADIPYSHHITPLHRRLVEDGYTNIFATEIVRDPSSPLPNRTLPPEAKEDPETLKQYSIFHIATPPTSLLLILSSRVNRVFILPVDNPSEVPLESSTSQMLRRRYALITRLSTVSVFGILINTLSVSNYMAALQHCQDLITRAGKKFYVFVVGKVNAAKIANFAEIGGWVVIGCWESSLIESKEFFRPIITPFELEAALTDDKERVWGGEWIGDFSQLLGRDSGPCGEDPSISGAGNDAGTNETDALQDGAQDSEEDEPPEFDLRTGRYVSNSRPMGRSKASVTTATNASSSVNGTGKQSSALIQRATGEVATINGTVSPAAEFLRTQRTWQGLGSDYEIAYERDENGKIRGAVMEEGRSGIARGYAVGEDKSKT